MLQLEVLVIYVALATIDVMILLALCFSHKREVLKRIHELKDNWLDTLPLKFAELGDDVQKGNLTPQQTRKKLTKIIKSYDLIEEISKAYSGKRIGNNILKLLGFNLIIILGSVSLALASTYTANYSIVLVGGSLAALTYYFIFMAKIIYFIIKEEDKFQKIE